MLKQKIKLACFTVGLSCGAEISHGLRQGLSSLKIRFIQARTIARNAMCELACTPHTPRTPTSYCQTLEAEPSMTLMNHPKGGGLNAS